MGAATRGRGHSSGDTAGHASQLWKLAACDRHVPLLLAHRRRRHTAWPAANASPSPGRWWCPWAQACRTSACQTPTWPPAQTPGGAGWAAGRQAPRAKAQQGWPPPAPPASPGGQAAWRGGMAACGSGKGRLGLLLRRSTRRPKLGAWATRGALANLRTLGRAVFTRLMPRIAVLHAALFMMKDWLPEWDTPGGHA